MPRGNPRRINKFRIHVRRRPGRREVHTRRESRSRRSGHGEVIEWTESAFHLQEVDLCCTAESC